MNEKEIKKLLEDDNTSFNDFYNYLRTNDDGNWDNVNSEEIITQYVAEMIPKGIHVSHIVKAMEDSPSNQDVYEIWLGNSMETPKPINTKQELYDALFG